MVESAASILVSVAQLDTLSCVVRLLKADASRFRAHCGGAPLQVEILDS